MARLATTLFIAFIVCNARCFAQNLDLNTMLANLLSIQQGLTTQLTALTTNQTAFQNSVTNQNQNIIASGSGVLQSYQNELAAVLDSPNVNASSCKPKNDTMVQTVQAIQTNALACTLNVSNVGNSQYENPISQNIGISSILIALIADIINCIRSALVTCISSLQTRYTNLISELAVQSLPTVAISNLQIGLQSLLGGCFNAATSYQPAEAQGAANIANATTCMADLQSASERIQEFRLLLPVSPDTAFTDATNLAFNCVDPSITVNVKTVADDSLSSINQCVAESTGNVIL